MKPLNLELLIDPVCGMVVNTESAHRCVRGGAMFYFCSQGCRTRFLANPLHFVVVSLTERDVSAPTSESSMKDTHKNPDSQEITKQSAHKSNKKERHRLDSNLGNLVGSWFLAWRERRHAERTSSELLVLYRAVSAEYFDRPPREIYLHLVMARNQCDEAEASAVLFCVEESFAEWPVKRELTLCDVVHYLSVSEFLATHRGKFGMHSNIKLVVSSRIPPELCINARRIKN